MTFETQSLFLAIYGIAGNFGLGRYNSKRLHDCIAVHMAELTNKCIMTDDGPTSNKRCSSYDGASLHNGKGFNATTFLQLCIWAYKC